MLESESSRIHVRVAFSTIHRRQSRSVLTRLSSVRADGGYRPRTRRCLRTLLYLPGLRGKDTIAEVPMPAFLSRAGGHRMRGSSYRRSHDVNRSKFDKDRRCGASRSASVDLTADTRASDGIPIQDAHFGQVAS